MVWRGAIGYLEKPGIINRLRFAWVITACRMAEYCILLPAAILELQQSGLQETRQVV